MEKLGYGGINIQELERVYKETGSVTRTAEFLNKPYSTVSIALSKAGITEGKAIIRGNQAHYKDAKKTMKCSTCGGLVKTKQCILCETDGKTYELVECEKHEVKGNVTSSGISRTHKTHGSRRR